MKKEDEKMLFSTELTAKELFVLAAFLGYDTVVGVSGIPFGNREMNPEKIIYSTRSALEKRGLIKYGLDGTLSIAKYLRKGISVICNAENIVTVCSNTECGNRQKKYIFKLGKWFVVLQKVGMSRMYSLCVGTDCEFFDVFGIDKFKKDNTVENCFFEIPFDEIKSAKKSSHGFEDTSLTDVFEKYCNSGAAKLLSNALNSSGEYVILKLFVRCENEYKISFSGIYILADINFEIYLKNSNLCVRSKNIVSVYDDILAAL